MREIDNYFYQKSEPGRACLLALREHILKLDKNISEAWKYRMPFFCYKEKMFCYLWVHKKLKVPYIGLVDGTRINHPLLIQEKRARMKILPVDPTVDLPFKTIDRILKTALAFYK